MKSVLRVMVWVVIALMGMAVAQEPGTKPEVVSTAPASTTTANHFLVFLTRPANAPQFSKEKLDEIQTAHMANIKRMYTDGELEIAGPFMDDSPLRGLFVFKAGTLEEVKKWVGSDPAVKAGRVVGDIHPWTVLGGTLQHPADQTGTEDYVLVIVRKGDKLATASKDEREKIKNEHLSYLSNFFMEGKLLLGGRFDPDASDLLGISIFKATKAEVEKIIADDPATKTGMLKSEPHEWMTGKGILEK